MAGQGTAAFFTNWGSYGIGDVAFILPNFFGCGADDQVQDQDLLGWLTEADTATDRDVRTSDYSMAVKAATEALFDAPRHPYTRALLAATLGPRPDAGLPELQLGAAAADPFAVSGGCVFAPRCLEVQEICRTTTQRLRDVVASLVRCGLVHPNQDSPHGTWQSKPG